MEPSDQITSNTENNQTNILLIASIILGILIVSLIGVLITHKSQPTSKYTIEEVNQIVSGYLPSFLPMFGAAPKFPSTTNITLENDKIIILHSKEFNSEDKCYPCAYYSTKIVYPVLSCYNIPNTTLTYCNGEKKFSELVKEIYLNDEAEIPWIQRPIYIDGKKAKIIDIDVSWFPSENSLIEIAKNDPEDLLSINYLKQDVKAIIPYNSKESKNISIPISFTNDNKVYIDCGNHKISEITSTCAIIEKIYHPNSNEYELKISCEPGNVTVEDPRIFLVLA